MKEWEPIYPSVLHYNNEILYLIFFSLDNKNCGLNDINLNESPPDEDENGENWFEPFIGQCFLNEQEAFQFYENFAKSSDFSICKGRFTIKNGRINRQDFYCHREGYANEKKVDPLKDQRNRASLRCGCKARMQITLRKSFEIFPKEWHLVVSHNHPLLPPEQVRLLPSYRHISEEDERQILLFKEAGLSIRQIIRLMVLEKQLKHGDVPFFQKDVHNFLNNPSRQHGERCYRSLRTFVPKKRTQGSNMLSTFVILMKKLAKTIITDPDPWITQAIAMEMPSAKHAFGIWHIIAKFSGWFQFLEIIIQVGVPIFTYYTNLIVLKTLKSNCLFNKHVIGLYEIKQYWVPAYLRHCFFGGMTTTRRYESIIAFVKRFTSSKTCLMQLIRQVDLTIEKTGQTQLCHTMLDTYRGSSLRTLSPLEDQAYKVLTKFSFKRFQEDLGRASQYKAHDETDMVYMVDYYKDPYAQRHKVFWNASYLPLHWCRDEFHSVDSISTHSEEQAIIQSQPSNANASTVANEFVRCPPISTTKGRPKSKQSKGGKELAKQTKSCRLCKKSGHNIPTCPDKENFDVINFSSAYANKRKKIIQGSENLNPIFYVKCSKL
ncbi:LOW QUALITY PROTEIN: hypothetical protein Cgig2_020865 [Carnegiea gigantea]|uniref:Protein FAR1-RELATED SEQUENCE n=1 Tax=Carnegiea gigantea TaxID=171969 RepID=A0A9Q1KIA1_9CARY|nr:LOW QUALITY PROTEIN: hypothetical protein Cgig2_020865 [Carnegiea gigantea]